MPCFTIVATSTRKITAITTRRRNFDRATGSSLANLPHRLGGLAIHLGVAIVAARDPMTRAEAARVLGRIGDRILLFTLSDAYRAEADAEVKKALRDALTALNDKR